MGKSKLDSDQPLHEVGGLQYRIGSEVVRPTAGLDPTDQSPLANAIRAAFPDSDPAYWSMIARRFRELYKGLTEEEAVRAVANGYSSPVAAMRAGVIRKRKYIGFAGVQP